MKNPMLPLLFSVVLFYSFAASNDLVNIDGKSYSVLKRPSKDSEIVVSAHKEVSMTLDFQDMSSDLILIAKFFQLAENGLVDHPVLQGKVKSSQITVLRLTGRSEVAFTDFARTTGRVIDDLEATYYYLDKGHIEMAKSIYTDISDDAKRMAEKAEDLYKKYENEVSKLQSILEETFGAKEKELQKKHQAEADRRNLSATIERLRVMKEEAHTKFQKMEALFLEAKRRERKATKKSNNIFKKVVNAFTSHTFGYEAFNMGAYKDAAKAYRAAKENYFREMEKVRDAKAKILADIAEFAQRMKNAKSVTELADIAIEALQKVIGELKDVISILANTANFWENMKGHLESLKKGDHFKYVMGLENKEEREEVIKSDEFRYSAVKNYARWVATYEAMRHFRHSIKPAQEELANVVRGNLNKEEALKNIQKLGQEISSEEWRRKIDNARSRGGKTSENKDEL